MIDTIGGGSSEIQKNIIARRKLGLPEELLSRARARDRPARHLAAAPAGADADPTARAGPLRGVTVLDLATRRPGGPVHPDAGRLRGHRGQGGGGARAGAPSPSGRPFYAYSGARSPPPRAIDLKDPDGPRRLPRPGRGRPTWWWRASGPGWSTGWASASRTSAPSTRGSSCARPPATARTAPGRPGPATTSTTWPWAATWPPPSRAADGGPAGVRAPPSPTPPAAGMQAAMAVMAALIGRGADGPGVHLDVSIADGVLWLTSLAVDEYLATGADGRARPQHHHRPVRLLRHLPGRRRPLAGGRGHRAQVLRQPVPAPRVRAVGGPPARRRRPGRRSGPTSRPPSPPGTATPGWPSWPRPTPVSRPVLSVAELVDDEQYRARRAFVEAVAVPPAAAGDGAPARVPPGGPGAGRHARRRTRRWWPATRPGRTPTQLLAAAGLAPARIAELRERGSGGMSAIGIDDIEGLIGVEPVRGGGGVPGRAGLHLDHLLVGGERQPALLGRRGGRRGDRRARSPRRPWSRCGSGPTTGHRAAPTPGLPLQIHFDLKEGLGLPEAVMSDNTIVFHEPVRPGDRLATRQILRSVSEEKTTKLGTGRFWVIDVEYRNQRGDLVAVESYTGFGYRRSRRHGGGPVDERDPARSCSGPTSRWATGCPSWPIRSPPPPWCSGPWPPATGGPCTTTRTSPSTATAPGTSSSTRPTWRPGSSGSSPTGPDPTAGCGG